MQDDTHLTLVRSGTADTERSPSAVTSCGQQPQTVEYLQVPSHSSQAVWHSFTN